MRILKNYPLLKLVNSYVIESALLSNLSYLWNLGSLLDGLMYLIIIFVSIFITYLIIIFVSTWRVAIEILVNARRNTYEILVNARRNASEIWY